MRGEREKGEREEGGERERRGEREERGRGGRGGRKGEEEWERVRERGREGGGRAEGRVGMGLDAIREDDSYPVASSETDLVHLDVALDVELTYRVLRDPVTVVAEVMSVDVDLQLIDTDPLQHQC